MGAIANACCWCDRHPGPGYPDRCSYRDAHANRPHAHRRGHGNADVDTRPHGDPGDSISRRGDADTDRDTDRDTDARGNGRAQADRYLDPSCFPKPMSVGTLQPEAPAPATALRGRLIATRRAPV